MVHSSSGKTKDLSTKALSLNGRGEGDLKGDFRVVYDVSRRHAMSEFVFQLESSLMQLTVFENHRKSRMQHCERSELRLHFKWTEIH